MRVFPQPVVDALTRSWYELGQSHMSFEYATQHAAEALALPVEQRGWHVKEASWHRDRSSAALGRALTALDAEAVRADSMVTAARDTVTALRAAVDSLGGIDELAHSTLRSDLALARRTQPLVDGA